MDKIRLNSNELEILKKFQWTDDEECESNTDQPGFEFAAEIHDCAEAICKYIHEHMDINCYDSSRLTVSIPVDVHHLLKERYNSNWTEESRYKVFDLIKSVCIHLSEQIDWKDKLNSKINSIVPDKAPQRTIDQLISVAKERNLPMDHEVGTAHTKWKMSWMRLYDEPSVMMDGKDEAGEIVMEIQLESVKKV